MPKAPEEYPFELPKDFKPPQGVEFKLDDKDPLLPQARAFALKHGLSADGFREMMGLYAAGQVGNQQLIDNAKAAEVGKLGVNGPARKTAVDTWLNASVGEELGKHLSSYLLTEKSVEAIEKLMARDRGSAGGFTHANRETPANSGTIPGYETMTFEQRRHAQDRLRAVPAR